VKAVEMRATGDLRVVHEPATTTIIVDTFIQRALYNTSDGLQSWDGS
jgi:uncharacterized protein YjfI (DUF2170 family)